MGPRTTLGEPVMKEGVWVIYTVGDICWTNKHSLNTGSEQCQYSVLPLSYSAYTCRLPVTYWLPGQSQYIWSNALYLGVKRVEVDMPYYLLWVRRLEPTWLPQTRINTCNIHIMFLVSRNVYIYFVCMYIFCAVQLFLWCPVTALTVNMLHCLVQYVSCQGTLHEHWV